MAASLFPEPAVDNPMSYAAGLKRLEQREPPRGYREAIIMDDLVAPESVEEDETILGLSEIGWDDPDRKVWMRNKGESLSQLRQRVGRDAGCLEGELCLFDAVRLNEG
jgi:hypothetical protein